MTESVKAKVESPQFQAALYEFIKANREGTARPSGDDFLYAGTLAGMVCSLYAELAQALQGISEQAADAKVTEMINTQIALNGSAAAG